jgi:hypothetical protein
MAFRHRWKATVAVGRVNPAPRTDFDPARYLAHRRRRLGVDAAVSRDGYTLAAAGMPGLIPVCVLLNSLEDHDRREKAMSASRNDASAGRRSSARHDMA